MNYRRLLLIIDLEVDDARNAIAAIRRVAPDADALAIVAHLPERRLPWLATEGRRRHRLEINSLVLNGRLEFRWTFGTRRSYGSRDVALRSSAGLTPTAACGLFSRSAN